MSAKYAPLAVGSVVRLQSGGFTMTVGPTLPEDESECRSMVACVQCHWHDAYGHPHQAVYEASQLVVQPFVWGSVSKQRSN
jgi:uncharacterized protein YodC (DUF2158 family)